MKIEKGNKYWLLVCFGIAGVGLLGLFLMSAFKSEPKIRQEITQVPIINAQKLIWSNGRFEISANARVLPVETVNLQTQVSADVIAVYDTMKSGAYFSAGDVLLKLNPAVFNAKLNELDAQIISAKADLKLADTQFSRSKELFGLKAAAQEEVDQRMAALGAANARIRELEASIESAKIDLSRSVITAPFNGRVVSETVSVGDVLTPGTIFAEIYSTDAFETSVAFADTDAILIENLFSEKSSHQPARIEAVFGGARFSWPAKIDRVESGLDSATRTINIVVKIDAPEQLGKPLTKNAAQSPPLLPNMFVKVIISTKNVGSYMKVSRDAVRSNNTIWFVRKDKDGFGIIESANVKTLSNQQQYAFIRTEIEQRGDTYVLGSDIGNVLPGNRVQVRQNDINNIAKEDVKQLQTSLLQASIQYGEKNE